MASSLRQRDQVSSERVDLTSLDDDALVAHLDRLKDLLERGERLHFRLARARMPWRSTSSGGSVRSSSAGTCPKRFSS